MNDNKFELNEEQKKLCHELTMEYLRQNESLNKSQYIEYWIGGIM